MNLISEQNNTISRLQHKISTTASLYIFLMFHRISHCFQKHRDTSSFQDDQSGQEISNLCLANDIFKILKKNYFSNFGFVADFRALLRLLSLLSIQQRRPHDTVRLSVSQASYSISPVLKRTRHPFYLASKITKERKNGKENCTFRKTVVTGCMLNG